jgi:hypothetical protein
MPRDAKVECLAATGSHRLLLLGAGELFRYSSGCHYPLGTVNNGKRIKSVT